MIRLRAFAKLNLSLAVRGLRPDGFHEIESWVQTIDLHDELTVRALPSPRGSLAVDNDLEGISGRDLAEVAASAILEAKSGGQGASIAIRKGIPAGAGLGGGSSDAAAVLRALDHLLEPRLPSRRLREIAASIGSDVPLFLHGGSLTIRGRGEQIEWRNASPAKAFVLVTPPVHCDTRLVYQAWDQRRGDEYAQAGSLDLGRNDLQASALEAYPDLKPYDEVVRNVAQERGAMCGMSGSGSTLFVALAHWREAEEMMEAFERVLPDAIVRCCEPTMQGYEFADQKPRGVER